MNKTQIQKYLERMGYSGGVEYTGKVLDELIRMHISHIPFENLDVFDQKKVPPLDPGELYEKIVIRRRGGYCFELNTLFQDLLVSLGFCVFPAAARILAFKKNPPLSHMILITEAEGKKWLCDVGFGGPGPKGVMELAEKEQQIGMDTFRFKREEDVWRLQRSGTSGWTDVMSFEGRPFPVVDFEVLNFYCARCEKILFVRERVVNLTLPDGSKALTGMHFTARRGDVVSEKDCKDEDELTDILREEFGLVR